MPITRGQGNPPWARDETILALDVLLNSLPRVPGKESDEVRSLSRLLQSLDLHDSQHRNSQFRNVAGVYLKLQNLYSLHPGAANRKGLKTSRTDRQVWEEFRERQPELRAIASAIRAAAEVVHAGAGPADPDDDDHSFEGRILWRRHRVRERDRALRRKKIAAVRKRGALECEVCGTTPMERRRVRIEDAVFEIHHLMPLQQSGEQRTRLSDLAVLCANCHRRIHALARLERRIVSIAELRDLLQR